MLIPETPKPFKARPLCSSREGEHFELSSLVCSSSAFLSSSKSCLCLFRNAWTEASGVGLGWRMSKVILSDWAKLLCTFRLVLYLSSLLLQCLAPSFLTAIYIQGRLSRLRNTFSSPQFFIIYYCTLPDHRRPLPLGT